MNPLPSDLGVDLDTFLLGSLYAVAPYGITSNQLTALARTRAHKGITDDIVAGVLRELSSRRFVTTQAAALGPRHWVITAAGVSALEEAGLADKTR
jgi:hypothetical protein